MSRFPLPDDVTLERLIKESCEYMPGPDMARFAQLEQRLNRHPVEKVNNKSTNKLFWWIVLFITGGFAWAAWWTNSYFSDEPTNVPQSVENSTSVIQHNNVSTDVITGKEQTEDSETVRSVKSPVIYQREGF